MNPKVIVIALLAIASHNAIADTYTVNTSSDSVVANACANHQANCSLRGAILAANAHSGDTINFGINEFCPPSGCAIGLLSALPDISAPMTISGPTLHVIQRGSSAATQFRIFNVTGSGTVNFTSLTIAQGILASGSGAGIQNAGPGTVNITNCTLRNNSAPSDGGAICNKTTGIVNVIDSTISNNGSTFGGGISSSGGQVTVKGSTFSGNTATGPPAQMGDQFGGTGRGGAIDVGPGTLVVSNSTFYNNSVTGGSGFFPGAGAGGAISYRSTSLQVTNCTLFDNHASSSFNGQGLGGGIDSANASGPCTIKSTIIAGNSGSTTADVNGSFTSAGFNLIGKKDGSTGFTAATDLTGTAAAPLDPKVDSNGLQNNGGPTQTIALIVGSPAIDKGSSVGLAGNLTIDQRGSGFPRIFDDATVANANGGDGADIGAFELQVAQPTPTPTATPSTLANISTRLAVQTGDNALIGGFIITGTQPKKVILRAIGPSLNLPGQLANPTLELYTGSTLLASNDDWQNQPAADRQAVIDSTIPPSNDLESALVRTLPANGSSYTAIVRGAGDGTGIGVVEAYDLDRAVDSKLANISTRGFVQTGDNVLIAGTIILGDSAQKVIIRAIGPSLSVPGKLGDPTLELHDGNGATLESNDNWMDSPNKQAIIDSTIPPSDPSESAIVRTLPAGGATYTAIVRGVNGTTGVAVVEVYALD